MDSAPEMANIQFADPVIPAGEELDLALDLSAILDGPNEAAGKIKKPRPTVELALSAGSGRKARKAHAVDLNPYGSSIVDQVQRKKVCADQRSSRRDRDPLIAGWGISQSEVDAQRRQLMRFTPPMRPTCICLGANMVGFVCGCQAVPEAPSSMGISLGVIDMSDIADTPNPCCVCLGNDCEGGSNKFTCNTCLCGCCEAVALQSVGTLWCLTCPNMVDGKVCGGPLTASGKAKKKEQAIKANHTKIQVVADVQNALSAHGGYFGKCLCGEDYFFEEGSPSFVPCGACHTVIPLFSLPAPELWDAASTDAAFLEIYGRKCPTCHEQVTRTPEYEIRHDGRFNHFQSGECAATLHDKCGTALCIGGNPDCGAFLKKTIRGDADRHHVSDHHCKCYGAGLKRNGTCASCNKCRLYCSVQHWVFIFLQAKVKWYTKNLLPVPQDLIEEIEEMQDMYVD